jgi:hypothetical protein
MLLHIKMLKAVILIGGPLKGMMYLVNILGVSLYEIVSHVWWKTRVGQGCGCLWVNCAKYFVKNCKEEETKCNFLS